jgi:lipopolysaccharide biosynthesis regulator YciM
MCRSQAGESSVDSSRMIETGSWMVVRTDEGIGQVHEVLSEYRCPECGYGARARIAPERCPMCSSTVWDYVARERLRAAVETLDAMAPLTRDTA